MIEIPFIFKMLITFVIGAVPGIEIYLAIPLGVIIGLSPLMAAIAAVTGNVLTVVALSLAVPRFKSWILRKFLFNHTIEVKKDSTNRHQFLLWNRYGISVTASVEMNTERRQRLFYLWHRYGVPGLALGSPVLMGTHLVAALGVVLGVSMRRVLFWSSSAILVWGIILAIISNAAIYHLGLADLEIYNLPNWQFIRNLLNLQAE